MALATRADYPSIRVMLLALVAVPLAAFFALLVYGLHVLHEVAVGAANEQSAGIAHQVAAQTARFIAEAQRDLAEIAARPRVRALDPEDCDPLLAAMLRMQPAYANVLTLDAGGRRVCSAAPVAPGTPAGPDPGYYVDEVLRSRRFTIGRPARGFITGRWVSTLVLPVLDDSGSSVAGMVGAAVDLESYRLQAFPVNVPPHTVVSLLARDGTLLARSPEAPERIGKVSTSEAAVLAVRQRAGTARAQGHGGIEYFLAFAAVPGSDWTVVVGSDVAATLEPIRRQAFWRTLAGVSAALAVFALVLAVKRRIERPLQDIAITVARIREGHGEARAAVSGSREVAAVARELNATLDAAARMEGELRESERRYRDMLDHVDLLSVMLDTEGRVTYCNEFLARLVGVPQGDIIGSDWFARFLPAGSEDVKARFVSSLAGAGIARHFENEILTGSGERRLVHWNNSILRNPAGEVVGTASIGEDITERRSAEEALRRSEQRLRDILDGLGPEMFVGLLDTEGTLLEANGPALEAGGLTRGDVLGKPVDQTYWWSYSAQVQRELRDAVGRAAGGQHVRYDAEVRVAADQRAMLDLALHPFRDSAGRVTMIVASAVVITQRHAAEQALRASEGLLRLFVDHVPAAIAMFDRDMRYLRCNRRWLTDYGLGEQDLTGRSHYDVFPDLPERWKDVHRRCLAGAVERCEDDPFPHADGSTDWVSWEIRPWRTDAGTIGGLVIFSEVVTPRKRAEEARRESDERIRKLFEQAADGIFVVGADNRYVDANAAGLEMLGYSREELLGLGVADVLAEHELPRVAPGVARMMAGTPHVEEWVHRRKDGSTFSAEVSARPLSGGSQYLAIVRDLTHRRESEKALRESALRLQLAAQAGNVGLWDWERATNRVYYSPEWKRQLGCADAEIPNEYSAWRDRLHPDDREEVLGRVQAYLDGTGSEYRHEFRLRHKDGTYRWILAQGAIFRDARGTPQRILGTHLDITERKEAEQVLESLAAELRSLNRRLAQSQEAERRRVAKELHDRIGGALAALGLNLAIASEQLPPGARPKLAPRLAESIALLDETSAAVRDLMVFLRPPVLDDFGLAAALRWHGERMAKLSAFEVIVRAPEESARYDPEVEIALFRIAQEALTNVAKHASARHVEVTLEPLPGGLRMVVADDGSGFDPARAQEASWGFLTMRERAGAVGGNLGIESAPGRGTRVTVEIAGVDR
jgi:two-component system sensor histidine kinase UhpB